MKLETYELTSHMDELIVCGSPSNNKVTGEAVALAMTILMLTFRTMTGFLKIERM
jgi:hypothetical protein